MVVSELPKILSREVAAEGTAEVATRLVGEVPMRALLDGKEWTGGGVKAPGRGLLWAGLQLQQAHR